MPVDDLYWNSIDFGSEESLQDPPSKQYVDPWDLENYAYIREHLDSIDLNSTSNPSTSGSAMAVNSTSFHYVPGDHQQIKDQQNYVAIEEIQDYRTKNRPIKDRNALSDRDFDDSGEFLKTFKDRKCRSKNLANFLVILLW